MYKKGSNEHKKKQNQLISSDDKEGGINSPYDTHIQYIDIQEALRLVKTIYSHPRQNI